MKIVISIIICLTIGFLSGFATSNSIADWYVDLNKPFFNPPNWIFGPVWTLLYVMMGAAVGLVWKEGWDKPEVQTALKIFGVQLLLNAAWSLLFFGLKNPAIAFIDILFLWIAIIICIKKFFPIKKLSAYLLVPYFLWVTFAAILNLSIWILNS